MHNYLQIFQRFFIQKMYAYTGMWNRGLGEPHCLHGGNSSLISAIENSHSQSSECFHVFIHLLRIPSNYSSVMSAAAENTVYASTIACAN